jgi:dTDP-4-amino-4,6-dideoxygalactose transaminase
LAPTRGYRDRLIQGLAEDGISSVFHYVPLHSSPAGRRFGRAGGDISVASSASDRLLRLPLWSGMGEERTSRVIESVLTHGSQLPPMSFEPLGAKPVSAG